MRTKTRLVAVFAGGLALSIAVAGCSDDPASPAALAAAAAADERVQATAMTVADRTPLQDGLAHYTYDLALGPGEFDVVRLHRIVRERSPYDPARTASGIFMLPGAPNSWVQIFAHPLISEAAPWDQSVAIYLARNGIDVWGMDYAWAQVPIETEAFGFMEGWGVARDIELAYEALSSARSIRVATGQGNSQLPVLGFSYGGPIAYGIAALETQLPPGQRQVRGLIPVDTELKLEDPARRAAVCDAAEANQAVIDGGKHHIDDIVGLIMLAIQAETNPVARTILLTASASGIPHFVGGYFDESGTVTGLRFTDEEVWIDVARHTRPYWPAQARLDVLYARCDQLVDVAFDDDIEDIAVPILYVGAAGGADEAGAYSASLTATGDYDQSIVQLLPDGEEAFDFGHADLFTAADAPELVGRPILEWLREHHAPRPGRGAGGD